MAIMRFSVKFFCSVISFLVFATVIFGGPTYDIFHGNWPGRGTDVLKLPFEKIRSGVVTKRIEKQLRAGSSLDELSHPPYSELRYLVTGATNPGVVVGQDNWLFLSGRLTKPGVKTWGAMPDIVKALGELTRYLESNGVFVVFELAPRKQTLHPDMVPSNLPSPFFQTYEPILNQMRAEGLNVPDLRPALSGLDPQLYMTNDSHWTPEGCHVAAKVIADFIVDNIPGGQVPGARLESKFYRSPPRARVGYEQTLLGFRKNGWLNRQFTNHVPTVFAGMANSREKPLYGATRSKPILVIGTSMSGAPYFTASQLIGWLGVNVENHSKAGFAAGYRGVEKFLQFMTGKRRFPKVLVWEIPEDFIAREGRYMLEPLLSVQEILGDAPLRETQIALESLEMSGITGEINEFGIFSGKTTGPKAAISFALPRSIDASSGTVLKFDITIPEATTGPHLGLLRVKWGSKSGQAKRRSKEIILRVTPWMHTILIPLKGDEGETFDYIRILPLTSATDLRFGRFGFLTKIKNS